MMRRAFYVVAVAVVAVGTFFLAVPRQEIRSGGVTDFDEFVAAVMEENTIPGLSLAVIKDNSIKRIKGYGFANVASRRKMTADTPVISRRSANRSWELVSCNCKIRVFWIWTPM